MPKVFQIGNVRVYVYAETGGRHYLAHCHIYVGNASAYVVTIEDGVRVLDPDGAVLPRKVRILVMEHLEKIRDAWNTNNPHRPI